MSRPLKVMLVAVEASADALGAGLARALRRKLGEGGISFVGVGGSAMAAEGIASPFDIADLSLVGVVEVAAALPRVFARIAETVRLGVAEQPDVAVLIDSWGITSRVAQGLRRRAPDIALVKYVAPQVWATRPGRARALARTVDHLMTLFAFEPPYFEAEGLATTFVGSPSLSRSTTGADPAGFRARLGLGPDAPILLLLPGSRPSELKRVLPLFQSAAMILKDQRPDLAVAAVAAPTVAQTLKAQLQRAAHRIHVVEGDAAKFDAMTAATLAFAKSGTVTSELAMAGCPMIVGYRVHPVTAFVARRLIRVPYLTLFNIAADEAVAPELIQEALTVPALVETAARLLDDPRARAHQAAAQQSALATLGRTQADPFDAAAEAVLATLDARGLRGQSGAL